MEKMVELAEDEMLNLVKGWLSILVSLSYCYVIGKVIPKGFTRLVAILPIISLFLALPLNLTSIHFCGLTSFFISWLANFKLLLFAFGKPPLCFDHPISFPRFIALACLPIKLQQKRDRSEENSKNPPKTLRWNYIIKGTLLALIIKIYDFSKQIPEEVLWLIYSFHIYFALEILLACVAKAANFFLGVELEPQFNEPLLSTSLQDFWGRRWNLMVTSILRPTVYRPTVELSTKFVGTQVASMVGVMATFAVSAIMHEVVLYHLGRVWPTRQMTWFFLLHGLCLCLEIAVKKYLGGKMRVPRWFSGVLTAVFVVVSGLWLFLPPLLGVGLITRGLHEYAVVGAFMERVRVLGK